MVCKNLLALWASEILSSTPDLQVNGNQVAVLNEVCNVIGGMEDRGILYCHN